MSSISIKERIYFLDAMRSILMALGVVLHSANVFSGNEWVIQDSDTSEFFTHLASIIHYFRMPTFFMVSGFFCHMTLARYGSKRFLTVRIPRIVIPLVVTAITLNSLQYILTSDYRPDGVGLFTFDYIVQGKWVSHLWFLNSLVFYFLAAAFIYTVVPKRLVCFSKTMSSIIIQTKGLYLLLLPFLSMVLIKISYILPIENEGYYDLGAAVSIKYSIYFIFGVLLGFSRNLLLDICRPRLLVTIIIFTVCMVTYLLSILEPDNMVIKHYSDSLITWASCFICFYIFHIVFNESSRFFSYFSGASYTVYLFHHLFVIIYGIVLIGFEINIFYKFTLLVSATFITTLLIHHYLIMKIPVFRYLFNGK
jgi:glucan biosynthesis protein C